MSCLMAVDPLSLDIRRIVTDSDLDGVTTAAILKRWWVDAEVVFGHPGELRAGLLDSQIDGFTAVCDLPRHANCGLSIDHHQSNEPTGDVVEGTVILWEPTPSAARIAYDLVRKRVDLSDLAEFMEWVDKLDGGGVTRDEYMSDEPAIWLGRVIDVGEGTALAVMDGLTRGDSVEQILSIPSVAHKLSERKAEREQLTREISERTRVVDRLAISRLEDLGMRSNGYHVTAHIGDECDACMVIHGNVGASFGEDGRYPVSASFYTNSFLHREGGIFDLTNLATHLDPDGGGHANACGCRIQALEGGNRTDREVSEEDIEANIAVWLKLWSNRKEGQN